MGNELGQKALDACETSQKGAKKQRINITFEDNNLIALLLGEFDSNLAFIEEKLGIEAYAKGNMVTFKGPEDSCQIAKSVLIGLYDRLTNGEQFNPGDLDGAIRHAQSKPTKLDGSESKDDVSKKASLAQIRTRKRLINGRTPTQSEYIRTLYNDDLVFAMGPAGTGKTYLAVAYAAACWERGEIERIILSRPAVEAGERLGFLPGDMRDKVDPYLRPLYDALYDVLPAERVERGLENNTIEIAPLAFMRGRTLSHSFVILDEAQNCTAMQMKMFLTRLGENSKMVITGDPSQIDLPKGMASGLTDAVNILRGVDGIGKITFSSNDVVRRDLVARIVAAYDKAQ